MTAVDEAQRLVEWDWLYALPRFNTLHHGTEPPDAEGGEDWPCAGNDLTATCGVRLRRACIPGIFSRMSTKRCARCCDRLGYPRGFGSPKNDDACRPLVFARLAALFPEVGA